MNVAVLSANRPLILCNKFTGDVIAFFLFDLAIQEEF